MELVFDESKHIYKVDGNVVPSVTEICKFYNYDVASNGDKWTRGYYADRGTKIHEYTVAMDYGEDAEDCNDRDIYGYCKAYAEFLKDHEVKWLGTEEMCGCETYAGTIDRWGLFESKHSILDIKTSSKINHAYVSAQLHGYEFLLQKKYEELKDVNFDLLCLSLQKDGTYVLYNEKTTGSADSFLDAYRIYNNLKYIKGEKI